MALTIPDTCYKYDSSITTRGRQGYMDWYKKWVKVFSSEYFTPENCYALRCSLLHSSNADIATQDVFKKSEDASKDFTFRIKFPKDNSDIRFSIFLDDIANNTKILDIDGDSLTFAILEGCREFVNKNNVTIELTNIIFQ